MNPIVVAVLNNCVILPFSEVCISQSKAILQTEDFKAVSQKFDYAVRLDAMTLVTGEVGLGKSTTPRWVVTQFEGDCKPWLPMKLAGQNNRVDKFE